MVVMNTPDFLSFSEAALLRSLTSREHRPNLLVVCPDLISGDVLAELHASCTAPFHYCSLPGALQLPDPAAGTVVLHDVAALSLPQQIELFDWVGRHRRHVQVVSLTHQSLPDLVRSGRFLEGLFYRLNTVRVHATRESHR
jgi:transcriptional regulator of aromatic amino acid metabolism